VNWEILLLKVSEADVKMLLRSMKIPPDDVALAFTMRAHILEHVAKDLRYHRVSVANQGLTLQFHVHKGLGKMSRKISACIGLSVWCISQTSKSTGHDHNMYHPYQDSKSLQRSSRLAPSKFSHLDEQSICGNDRLRALA
jgi:hypothetical protein